MTDYVCIMLIMFVVCKCVEYERIACVCVYDMHDVDVI